MFVAAAVALFCATSAAAAPEPAARRSVLPESAVIDACAQDVLADVDAVRGRNAWAARCLTGAPAFAAYPEGAFVCVPGQASPSQKNAPCPASPAPFVVCTGEGLLGGQLVRTKDGWVRVAELAARGVKAVGSWDSRVAPDVSRLVDSPLLTVLARPYNGPVVSLETAEGALLDCTAGQPLLRSNGTLVRADAVQWGDALLGDDGVHHVERVTHGHRRTLAYQVLLQRGDFDHNVFDVGGLFVGALRLVGAATPAPENRSP